MPPASARFIVVSLLLALVLQVGLYWPTMHQMPFGDDWGPPLSEIVRGDTSGPLSFFTETRQPDSYRPMQSLLVWLFGRGDEAHRWASIRVLHFLSSGIFVGVLGLMLRAWRVGRAGVIVGALVAVLHPTLVAPVGDIDGFSSLLSCAAVWWGVWLMYQWRDRPGVSIAFACVALIVGTLVKEYAFAMTPMAVLFAWTFQKPRWRTTFLAMLALGVLTFFLLWVRRYTKPTDMGPIEADFEVDGMKLIAQNIALVLAGGFFLGDALWVYVERSPIALAVSGAVFVATLLLLVGGLWAWWTDQHGRDARSTRKLLFLILSIPVVTFPANLVMRVSEMYLCGLVLTVALLAALAADGWAFWRRGAIAGFVFVALMISCVLAVRHKMAGMIGLGERTKLQTDGLLAAVDEAALKRGVKRVAVLHRRDQIPPRGTFSAYRLPDTFLVRPPAALSLWPNRGVELICVTTLPDERAVRAYDVSVADVVLYWDAAAGRYERLK